MILRFPALVLFCASLLVAACSKEEAAPKAKRPPAPVTVSVAQQRDVPRLVRAVGNVASSASVAVKSRIMGELVGVHFKDGQDVKRGQRLFTIDPRPYEAALREARSRLDRDRAQLTKAQEDARRFRKLVEGGYVSREQYEQAETNAAALRGTVRSDDAQVESAALQLTYCTILSPADGRAGAVTVDRGNVIKANDDNKSLVTIDTIEPVYVNFSVPEVHLPAIQERLRQGGVPVDVTPLGAGPVRGSVDFVDSLVDARTGTIRLRASFPNTDRKLWPGQYVDVALVLGEIRQAVVVPETAVQNGVDGAVAYVIDAANTAQLRKLKVGPQVEGVVVVEKGVAVGEQVVTDGHMRIAPGATVEIKAQPAPRAGTGGVGGNGGNGGKGGSTLGDTARQAPATNGTEARQ